MENIAPPEYQNLNQNTSPSIPQNNIYKILFFIFLGLFLIVSSVLVTLLFTQKTSEISDIIEIEEQKTAPTKMPVSEVTNIPTIPVTKSTITPTSSNIPKDWKNYTDSIYKFSINYPSDWTVTKESTYFSLISADTAKKIKESGPSSTYGPELSISFYKSSTLFTNEKVKNFEEFVNQDSNVKKITINGINGYSVTTAYPDHRIYLEKGDYIVAITDQYSMSYEDYKSSLREKIINTLKFN